MKLIDKTKNSLSNPSEIYCHLRHQKRASHVTERYQNTAKPCVVLHGPDYSNHPEADRRCRWHMASVWRLRFGLRCCICQSLSPTYCSFTYASFIAWLRCVSPVTSHWPTGPLTVNTTAHNAHKHIHVSGIHSSWILLKQSIA